jgi:putative copper export protein
VRPRLRWRIAVGFPVALAILIGALTVGHAIAGRPPGDLPYAGAGTEWALPIARLLRDLAAVATVGFLALAAALLPAREGLLTDTATTGQRLARRAALLWLIATVVESVLNLSQIAAEPVPRILSANDLWDYFTGVADGRAALGTVAVTALLAGLPRGATQRSAVLLLALAVVGLVLPPLFTGHSAASDYHDLAIFSLSVHIAAVALWVGGLSALSWLAATHREDLAEALPQFSILALRCFVVVGVTGVVNAGIRLERVSDLWDVRYGWLVLAKAGLFVTLGTFGCLHRSRTLPAAAGGDARAFARLAAAEIVVMAATFAVAVALSRSPTPPAEVISGFTGYRF